MKLAILKKEEQLPKNILHKSEIAAISELAIQSFKVIAPFWPLKNLIAVNPLQGLEDLPIEEAIKIGASYFQYSEIPEPMQTINSETIKWLQVHLDNGQATIPMPFVREGLYASWKKLSYFDTNLHGNNKQKQGWLKSLPENSEQTIAEVLLHLGIQKEEREQFLKLMLTTLPGWSSYIKYLIEWSGSDAKHNDSIKQADYLAIRLVITSLIWPEAKKLLDWHKEVCQHAKEKVCPLKKIQEQEMAYRLPLLKKISNQVLKANHTPEAQLIFCIDVRSEPFRRALESIGDYQTFGFAGFFGVPVQITDAVTGDSYASCPVLLSPKHDVKEFPCDNENFESIRKDKELLNLFYKLYQSLKYSFTTPFVLVEALGILSGVWMGLLSIAPKIAFKLKNSLIDTFCKPQEVKPSIDNITLDQQSSYAEGALRMMGLTHNFAPVIVFCGHGSTTTNNAYATALDCGACGGRHGASNARIIAKILNCTKVRKHLEGKGINIPETTQFLAAEHNTTTDEVKIFGENSYKKTEKLKQDLERAGEINRSLRMKDMQTLSRKTNDAFLRSLDWAQVRPEWGLARNSAFIIGPRDITSSLNLEGRCFLHSYDYRQDADGNYLASILTAPMVVAQWINSQYLFSTIDNVAYGSGSKITQNITGKIGIMQGNASDLMTGLPLQSVYSSDQQAYHEPLRLMTVAYAPRKMLDAIIQEHAVLQKLFGNGWVQMTCIEPDNHQTYFLDRDLIWQNIH